METILHDVSRYPISMNPIEHGILSVKRRDDADKSKHLLDMLYR